MSLIEDRVGMPKGAIKELFTTIATKHFDSICIDMTKDSPQVLRLNIWKPIELGPKGQDAAENDDCLSSSESSKSSLSLVTS